MRSSLLAGTLALAMITMSVSIAGAVPRAPACGGEPGLGCGAGMFCEVPDEACAGVEVTGRCEVVPLSCPRLALPVCGCNGRSYANDCERRAARYCRIGRDSALSHPPLALQREVGSCGILRCSEPRCERPA